MGCLSSLSQKGHELESSLIREAAQESPEDFSEVATVSALQSHGSLCLGGALYQLIQYLWTQAVDGHFNLPANNWVSPPPSSVHWVYKVSGF